MSTQEHLSALPTGYRLQDYQVGSVLGVGGFGITYLAADTQLGMRVAIKEYLPNTLAVRIEGSTVMPKSTPDEAGYRWGLDRFMKEAQTLARFRHPNIVRVLRFFEANGTGYTVMEYEQGQSLAEYLRAHPAPIREPELLKLLLPLLDGLKRVHEAGFLHRDIKPANIYLREDSSPVLIDFGSARQAMGSHTQSLTSVFTPGYAPFEQYFADGNQGPWTDIYALGAVLYRVVSGKSPLDAAKRVREDTLEPVSILCRGRYSAGFLHAIDQALLMSEEARPQSIDAWLTLLASHQAPAAVSEVPTHIAEAPTVTLPGGGGATRPVAARTAAPGASAAVPRPAATRVSPRRRQPKKKRGAFKTIAMLALAVVIVGGVVKHLKGHRAHATVASTPSVPKAPPPSAQSSLDNAANTPDANASPSVGDSGMSDTQSQPQVAPQPQVQPAVSPSTYIAPQAAPRERRPRSSDRRRDGGGGGLARRFAQADTNGDGYLSRAEVAAAFPRLSRMFNRIDRNHDGRLSEQEIQNAFAFQRRMRGFRGGGQR